MMERKLRWDRAGALAYVAWGLLHLVIGLAPVVTFLSAGPSAMLGTLQGVESVPSGPPAEPLRQATYFIAEHHFNLAVFGLLSVLVAVRLNWHGDRFGYWLNLITLGLVDLSFIFGQILPGYMPLALGAIGPTLYLFGALLTSVGQLMGRAASQDPAPQGTSGVQQAA